MNSQRPSARPTRVDVAIDAMLTTSDGVTFAVAIMDLSATGFRVEAKVAEELMVGEIVTIDLPKGQQLRGEIKWATGRLAGGALLES